MSMEPDQPRILTNMAFWQSAVWRAASTSIHPLDQGTDPAPLPWWREVALLWSKSPEFDVVVTQGARESLAYGLLCLLTRRGSRQVMTEVFIDHAREGSLAWRLKTSLFRAIARRSLGVLTNSTAEIAFIAQRFGLSADRLRYVPIEATVEPGAFPTSDDGFILSAGRSHRDYPLLLAAAQAIGKPIEVVCGADDLKGMPIPPNVTIRRELDRDAYLDILRRCTLVAIPLVPKERSTGQVVALEAMALGKPVVCSRVPGTVDYITHGQNGWLVPPGDAAALAQGVRHLLDHPDIASALAHQAMMDIREKHTHDGHARLKLKAISELWSTRS